MVKAREKCVNIYFSNNYQQTLAAALDLNCLISGEIASDNLSAQSDHDKVYLDHRKFENKFISQS